MLHNTDIFHQALLKTVFNITVITVTVAARPWYPYTAVVTRYPLRSPISDVFYVLRIENSATSLAWALIGRVYSTEVPLAMTLENL
jgi:hypothetical protein